MLLTIGAVLAGFVTMTLVVVVTTMLAARVMLPEAPSGGMQSPTTAYIAVNLLCGLAAAWLGGMVAARIAEADQTAVLALAGLVLVMGAASALGSGRGAQPTWYVWTIPIVGVVGVLLGGGVLP